MADEFNSPYPKSLAKLVEVFSRLPGIGKQSAERLAFYFLKCSKNEAMEFAFSIRDLKKNLRSCARCFNLAENEFCNICSNAARDEKSICVVEMPRDVIAIEKSGCYRGLYHVLLGHLAPTEGIGPENLKLSEFFKRVREEGITEVILATNPTAEGDITATYIEEQLKILQEELRVTRLARGLSSGTELEFAGIANLQSALQNRS